MDVLIVEDEDNLREAIRDGLEATLAGLDVEGAASVEEAEERIEARGWPQVIVSDVRLPGRSGIELLMEVRERQPRTKAILMSAYASPDSIEQVGRGGALRFLRKPFELSELMDEVREALEMQELSGSYAGITFLDILQVLHMSKKAAILRVRQDHRIGHIYVEDGEVIHADCGELVGTEAFNTMAFWPSPAFKVRNDLPKVERTIETSFGYLLMESARLRDEAEARENGLHGADVGPADPSTQEKEENMANLNEICKQLVDDTPEAVASNVVDLNSGMMLAGHFMSNFTTDHFEAVSAAVTNLFRGKETLRVENLVKAQRGVDNDDHYMQQVHFSTSNLEHFVILVPDRQAVLTLVLRKPGNIGMGWAAVRAAAPKLTAMVPT